MIYVQTNSTNPIHKLFATLIGITLLTLVLTFSVVMIPVIAVAGLIGVAYFYWKMRAIRKTTARQPVNEEFIDGHATVIRDDPRITPLR